MNNRRICLLGILVFAVIAGSAKAEYSVDYYEYGGDDTCATATYSYNYCTAISPAPEAVNCGYSEGIPGVDTPYYYTRVVRDCGDKGCNPTTKKCNTCSDFTTCSACTAKSGCGWGGTTSSSCVSGSSSACPSGYSYWYWTTTDCSDSNNRCATTSTTSTSTSTTSTSTSTSTTTTTIPAHPCSNSASPCLVSCSGTSQSTYIDGTYNGYFEFSILSTKNVVVGDNPAVGLDPKLSVGTTAGGSDLCPVTDNNGANTAESCTMNNLAAGTYYATVTRFGSTSGNDYIATLTCTSPATSTTTTSSTTTSTSTSTSTSTTTTTISGSDYGTEQACLDYSKCDRNCIAGGKSGGICTGSPERRYCECKSSANCDLGRYYIYVYDRGSDCCTTDEIPRPGGHGIGVTTCLTPAAVYPYKTSCGGESWYYPSSKVDNDTFTVGPCTIEISAKGWDYDDTEAVKYYTYSLPMSNSRTTVMDDAPLTSGNCGTDIKFTNTWWPPPLDPDPNRRQVNTGVDDKSATHSLGAGFTVSSNCAYNVELYSTNKGTNDIEIYSEIPMSSPPHGSTSYLCQSEQMHLGLKNAVKNDYIDWYITPQYCGDSKTTCGETCDPNDPVTKKADCTDANGDAGKKECNSGCTYNPCVASCETNWDCGAGRCCRIAGPSAIDNTCVGKGIDSVSTYLCDPGTWMKCDENSVGSKQEFNNRTFVCATENGAYKWEEKTSGTGVTNNNAKTWNPEDFFLTLIKKFLLVFVI